MDKREALESLETIRKILERSTVFAHIAPKSLFVGGTVAIGAAVLGWSLDWTPPEHPFAFLAMWISAFLVALLAGLSLSARRARALGERFWSRKLQFVLSGFVPTLIAAALFTGVLANLGRTDLCPGMWMVLYGLGILAVGMVLDWEFRATAWGFLLAGSITLFHLQNYPFLTLGATFGGLHVALGAFRLYREQSTEWQEREQPLRSFKV